MAECGAHVYGRGLVCQHEGLVDLFREWHPPFVPPLLFMAMVTAIVILPLVSVFSPRPHSFSANARNTKEQEKFENVAKEKF